MVELVRAKKPLPASSIEVIMKTPGLQLPGKDAFFLREFFLLSTDMYKIFFCSYHLRDWKLFSATTLLKF